MKSSLFWAFMYLFMAVAFVYLAIQQKGRTGEWDLWTIALMAIATYDFFIAIKYFRMKRKVADK
jgi:hypothetical protein